MQLRSHHQPQHGRSLLSLCPAVRTRFSLLSVETLWFSLCAGFPWTPFFNTLAPIKQWHASGDAMASTQADSMVHVGGVHHGGGDAADRDGVERGAAMQISEVTAIHASESVAIRSAYIRNANSVIDRTSRRTSPAITPPFRNPPPHRGSHSLHHPRSPHRLPIPRQPILHLPGAEGYAEGDVVGGGVSGPVRVAGDH